MTQSGVRPSGPHASQSHGAGSELGRIFTGVVCQAQGGQGDKGDTGFRNYVIDCTDFLSYNPSMLLRMLLCLGSTDLVSATLRLIGSLDI